MTRTTPGTMTKFSDVIFDPGAHAYTHAPTGRVLRSVSSIVAALKPPFDRDGISARVAARDGRTQSDVLAEWEAKGEAGRTRGTAIHAYAEEVFAGTVCPIAEAMNARTTPEIAGFRAMWAELRAMFNAEVVAKELKAGDSELGVATHIDAVLALTVDGRRRLHVFDWKSGKFTSSNRFEKLLPPLDDVENCSLAEYSVQVSLEQLILERNTPHGAGVEFGSGYLAHLRPDGTYHLYRATDYRERLMAMLLRDE